MASYDKAELAADFKIRCSFGSYDEPAMTIEDVDKWFRDAKVYGKKLTSTDTKIAFSLPNVKPDKNARRINFKQFLELCHELGKNYGDENEMIATLIKKHSKGTTCISETGDKRVVETSKYNGPHRERFDESGAGKGHDGRSDFDAKSQAGSGYVGGYK